MGGFCPGGIYPGGFCLGDFVWGILSGGFCPGEFFLEPMFNVYVNVYAYSPFNTSS